jgi:peptidyl-prolyl cis-trans isomerase C
VYRLTVILVLAAVAGCSKANPAEKPETAAAAAAPQVPATTATPPPASALPSSGPAVKPVAAELPAVVAHVNGEDITRSDFESALRNFETNARGAIPPTERDRLYRAILDDVISYRVLLQEARSRKIAVADAEVDARLSDVMKKQFASSEDFKKMLEARQLTQERVKAEMKNEMIVRRLIESEITPRISPKADEIEAFYKRDPKQFQVQEKVRASHVLIGVPAGADASTKAAAMSKAVTVLKKARAGGDFAALAREYSEDPGSATTGGDLGFLEQGKTVGPFNDVAFKLGKGEISDVVETEYGYHVIKVTDKQPARTVALDEARPQIENYLKGVNAQKETQAFVRMLRSKSKIEVLI